MADMPMSHCSLLVTPCPSTRQAEMCQYRGPAPTRGAGSVTQKGLGRAVGNHRGCVLVLKSLTEEFHPRSAGTGRATAGKFVL